MRPIVIPIIALALGLSACTNTIPKTAPVINFQEVSIPSQFLDCDGKKYSIPDPKKLTNKQIAKFVLRLVDIIEECQVDNSSVKGYLEQYNEQVRKINERLKNDKIQ